MAVSSIHVSTNDPAAGPIPARVNIRGREDVPGSAEEKERAGESQAYKVKIGEKAESIHAGGGEEGSSFLDIAIEKIKQQIEALKKMLAKLEGKEGEAQEDMRTDLKKQLAELHAKLADLLEKKAKLMLG